MTDAWQRAKDIVDDMGEEWPVLVVSFHPAWDEPYAVRFADEGRGEVTGGTLEAALEAAAAEASP
jgi:hypothetical protein